MRLKTLIKQILIIVILFCSFKLIFSQNETPSSLSTKIDTTPPLPPSDLLAISIEDKKIKLTWSFSPSDDVGLYNIYFDNGTGVIDYKKILASVNSKINMWISPPLNDNVVYKFGVRAVDTSGNEEKNTTVTASALALANIVKVESGALNRELLKEVTGDKSVTIIADVVIGNMEERRVMKENEKKENEKKEIIKEKEMSYLPKVSKSSKNKMNFPTQTKVKTKGEVLSNVESDIERVEGIRKKIIDEREKVINLMKERKLSDEKMKEIKEKVLDEIEAKLDKVEEIRKKIVEEKRVLTSLLDKKEFQNREEKESLNSFVEEKLVGINELSKDVGDVEEVIKGLSNRIEEIKSECKEVGKGDRYGDIGRIQKQLDKIEEERREIMKKRNIFTTLEKSLEEAMEKPVLVGKQDNSSRSDEGFEGGEDINDKKEGIREIIKKTEESLEDLDNVRRDVMKELDKVFQKGEAKVPKQEEVSAVEEKKVDNQEEIKETGESIDDKISKIDKELNDAIKEKQEILSSSTKIAENIVLNELKKEKSVDIKEKTDELLITLPEAAVNFDFNKADIKPKYFKVLSKIAEFLRLHPNSKVRIEGHTCDIGSDEYNMKLSERRAESVLKYFVEKEKLGKENFKTIGFGKTKPLFSNINEENRAKNRRVEIIIQK